MRKDFLLLCSQVMEHSPLGTVFGTSTAHFQHLKKIWNDAYLLLDFSLLIILFIYFRINYSGSLFWILFHVFLLFLSCLKWSREQNINQINKHLERGIQWLQPLTSLKWYSTWEIQLFKPHCIDVFFYSNFIKLKILQREDNWFEGFFPYSLEQRATIFSPHLSTQLKQKVEQLSNIPALTFISEYTVAAHCTFRYR